MAALPPLLRPVLPIGRAVLRAGGRTAVRMFLLVLLAAAACGTGLLWLGYEVQALRPPAAERLHGAATAAAGEVQALLQRVARATDPVRPEDALTTDRIGVAGRLLRAEPRVQPASGLFLFNARGAFVAGSAPLPQGAEDVSAQAWFRAGMQNGSSGEVRLAGPAADPLGRNTGVLLLRRLDRGGALVGLVGTFLRAETAWALLHQAWNLPAARLVLLDRDSQPVAMPDLLESAEAAATADAGATAYPPSPSFGSLADMRAWLRWGLQRVGTETQVVDEEPLGGWSLRVSADLLELLTPAEWTRAALKAGLAGLAVLLGGLAPAAFRASRGGRAELLVRPRAPLAASAMPGRSAAGPASASSAAAAPVGPVPAATGTPLLDADWIWELDARGRLVGVAGNAPTHLIQAIGTRFDQAAGPQAEQDKNWAAFRAAALNGDTLEGLDLPFAFPGPVADTIIRVRLAGKPVRDTGGYWGAALQLDTPQDVPRAAYRAAVEELAAAA